MSKLSLLLAIFILTVTVNSLRQEKIISSETTHHNLSVVAGETERFEQTYLFDSTGKIELSSLTGSITVESWDHPQIKLEYVKAAPAHSCLTGIDVTIEAEKDNFRVRTSYPKVPDTCNNQNLFVEFRLIVPRTARLDVIALAEGNIKISNFTNVVKVLVINGDITAKDLSGELNLVSVNGTVNTELKQIKTGSDVNLATVNGLINLSVPATIDAVFSGGTLDGSVRADLGLTVTKRKDDPGADLSGTIGRGSSLIRLNTVNGKILIKRADN